MSQNFQKESWVILISFFFKLYSFFSSRFVTFQLPETLQSTKANRNTYAHVVCGVLTQYGKFSSDISDDFLNMSCHKLFSKSITFVSLFNLYRIFHPPWWRQVWFSLFFNILRESSTAQICSWSVFNSQPLQIQSETMEVCNGLTVRKLSSIMLIYAWFIFFITLVQAACWQNIDPFTSCPGSESFYKWDWHVVIEFCSGTSGERGNSNAKQFWLFSAKMSMQCIELCSKLLTSTSKSTCCFSFSLR